MPSTCSLPVGVTESVVVDAVGVVAGGVEADVVSGDDVEGGSEVVDSVNKILFELQQNMKKSLSQY